MKSKWFRNALLGAAVFIMIVAGSLLFLRTGGTSELKELSLDDVVTRIEKGQVREAHFKQSALEITDVDGQKYLTNVGSDPTRERLLIVMGAYNKINTSKPITVREDPASTRFGWIILVKAAPFVLFFGFWAVTLGVIVWAVRTISGNKG
jgi:ATP-dependent Zn protease